MLVNQENNQHKNVDYFLISCARLLKRECSLQVVKKEKTGNILQRTILSLVVNIILALAVKV